MSLNARMLILCVATLCAGCSDDSTRPSRAIIAMRFVSLPASVRIDSPFSVSVELLGVDGERMTQATERVSLTLIGPGTMSGTTTATPQNGLAVFEGLRVSTASEALQLKAIASTTVVTSPTFRATDDCAPVATNFPVVLATSLGTTACTVDGRPAAFFRFTKPDFGPLQLVVTAAGFVPEVAVLNDPPSDLIPIAGAGTTATGNWVLPGAMYRLRISALSGAGGAFTVASSTVPVPGCVLRTLLPFALVTYSERIEGGDCVEPGRTYDWYQLYSPKPCTLTMRGVTTGFDALITVRNARTHAVIAENDNGAAGTSDAFVMLTECRAGTDPIEILATTPLANSSGNYSLTVQITGGVSLFSIGRGADRH